MVPTYEAIPGSGFLVFDCAKLKAALSPRACAANWTTQKIIQCTDCEIGRHFAGGKPAPPKLIRVCLRCGRQGRLVARCFCVSCRNRAAELWHGRNAKGKLPQKWAAILRQGCAIVRAESAQEALSALYGDGASTNERSCIQRSRRPYLPSFELIDEQHVWLTCWVNGRDELMAMAQRLLPNCEVIDAESHRSCTTITKTVIEKAFFQP